MSEERKMVLKMLDEGKISVDEAERILRALQTQNEPDMDTSGQEDVNDVQSPSEFVDWERWEERKQSYKQQSSGFKISQYIENVIQKIRDVDFDLNFGSFEAVKHIFQDHTDDFNDIKIKVKNGSIELTPWKDNYVQIDCDAKVYRVQSSDEARQRFLNEVYFDIRHNELFFSCDARDIKVNATIYIPEKMYESIECKLFNGNGTGNALAAREIELKTVNGSLSFPQLLAQQAGFETGNGTITVSGEANRLDIETINGAIDVKGMFRYVDAESFSGAITTHLQHEGNVSLKSTTSGIKVIVPKDVRVHGELVSSIGSVQCELHSFEVLHEKKDLAQRTLTFVSNKKAEDTLNIEANTKTGSITVTEQER